MRCIDINQKTINLDILIAYINEFSKDELKESIEILVAWIIEHNFSE